MKIPPRKEKLLPQPRVSDDNENQVFPITENQQIRFAKKHRRDITSIYIGILWLIFTFVTVAAIIKIALAVWGY
uniref:Uncharacterized protein n=1 Tax=Plectus sambesii TaxID=2011161 RepID=A0A914WEH9_9BILA